MSSTLKVETISDDNGMSLFRSKRLSVNGRQFISPLKALDPSKFRSHTILNKKSYGVREIFKNLDSDKIARMDKEPDEHDKFAKSVSSLAKKSETTELTLCFVHFTPETPNRFPTSKEIDFLTDVSHSYSDITPLPGIEVEVDASNFRKYKSFLKSSYDTIEELNHKPIMGVLSNLPRESYGEVIDFYLDRDITSFYFDFNGKTPDTLKLRPILRHLNSRKMLDNCCIYGINAKPGKPLKNAGVIPSKDFLSYGYGIDILGESHVRAKLPKELLEKMKRAIEKQQGNKRRLFIKSDYGYHRVEDEENVEKIYPKDSSIKLNDIVNDKGTSMQKLFNMEQQAIESSTIRKRLNSLSSKETILDYIRKKERVSSELKHLLQAASALRQRTLF